MTQAPVETKPAGAFEPPRNRQFSVFLDNRVGKLLDLLDVFEGQMLALAGLSVLDSANHAVVRVLTSNSDLAQRLLRRHELPFSECDVLAVELGEGRGLAMMSRLLLAAELNIHYAYPLLVRPRGLPAIVLACDDPVLAGQILRRKHFTLLAENDMGDNASRSTPGGPTEPTSN